MKTRSGFVSNSSSSSFIVIGNKNTYVDVSDYKHKPLVVNRKFGTTCFGWGPEEIDDWQSRIIFSYLQVAYVCGSTYPGEDYMKLLEMLESVIKEYMEVTEIVWLITPHYAESSSYNVSFKNDYGYIDHQSSAEEGENDEMFNDRDALKNFLFNTESSIQLDHDNG